MLFLSDNYKSISMMKRKISQATKEVVTTILDEGFKLIERITPDGVKEYRLEKLVYKPTEQDIEQQEQLFTKVVEGIEDRLHSSFVLPVFLYLGKLI